MPPRSFLGWDGDSLAFDDGQGGRFNLPPLESALGAAAQSERAAGRDPAAVYLRQGGAGLDIPPALDPGLAAAIPARRGAMSPDALADNGAGGGPGDGRKPSMMWSDAPAAAPPAVSDVPAGGMSRAPPREALVSQAPPPSPAAAPDAGATPTAGRSLPPNAPGSRAARGQSGSPAETQQAPRRLTQAEQDEQDLRDAEDERYRRAKIGSPIVRHDAAWLDKQRTIEGKQVDPAAIAGFIDAQDAATKSGAEVARYQAERDEEARQAEAGRGAKLAEHDAIQKEADEKAAKEDREFEDSLDRQRRELADPNSFWNDKSTGYKVAMMAAMALSGIGAAIAGREPGDLAAGLNRAIEADLNAKKANLGLLGDARRRARERYGDETKVREVARNAAMRQVDDTLKDIALRKANPIVRETVMEQVPESTVITDPFLRMANKVADRFRAMGHAVTPEQIAAPQPDEPVMVTRAREQVRYLGAEYQQAQQQLAAARERLGIAKDLASSQSLTSAFIPAHTTGGGGDASKLREQQLRDRVQRSGVSEDRSIKRGEAGLKVEERAEKGEEKAGARTFAMVDPTTGKPTEYIARPGTPDGEMTEVRKQGASLSAVAKEAHALKDILTIKDTAIRNKKLRLHSYTIGAAVNVATGNGAMTKDNEDAFRDMLTSIIDGGGSAETVDAALGYIDNLQRGKAQQIGATPRKVSKLWPKAKLPRRPHSKRRRRQTRLLSRTGKASDGPSTLRS